MLRYVTIWRQKQDSSIKVQLIFEDSSEQTRAYRAAVRAVLASQSGLQPHLGMYNIQISSIWKQYGRKNKHEIKWCSLIMLRRHVR